MNETTTIRIRRDTHRRLRIAAAISDESLQETVERAIGLLDVSASVRDAGGDHAAREAGPEDSRQAG